MEPATFHSSGIVGITHVLIMQIDVAVEEVMVHSVWYQVTVLSQPDDPSNAFDELDRRILQISGDSKP
jgi:hypothetical protein